jgi:hypothetical protein
MTCVKKYFQKARGLLSRHQQLKTVLLTSKLNYRVQTDSLNAMWMQTVYDDIYVTAAELRVMINSAPCQWHTQKFFSGGVYARNFFQRGVQQIQLRTEGRENGDQGAVA